MALKIALAIAKSDWVTRYEHGDRYQAILNRIETVRETWLIIDIEPEKSSGKINSDTPAYSSVFYKKR